MAVLKAIVSLCRAGEAEENKLFSSFQKKHYYYYYLMPFNMPQTSALYQTGTSFKDVRFMTPLPPDELSKGKEQTMKDWLENYRPVR